MSNLLRNPGFEADWGTERSHRCLVFPRDAAPYEKDVDNIFTPSGGWLTWFRHEPAVWDQPEARDAWRHVDERRVHAGSKAMLLFTYHRRHDAGFLQQVKVKPGTKLRLTAYAHAWSNHKDPEHPNDFPHPDDGKWSEGAGYDIVAWREDEIPELRGDPQNDAKGNFAFSVGIDPTGGQDPYAAVVVWGEPLYCYNGYTVPLKVEAVAQAETVTVFLRSTTLWPFKHCDAYWDSASLEVVNGDPSPPPAYESTMLVLPQDATREQLAEVLGVGYPLRRTIGFSHNDAGCLNGTAVLYNVEDEQEYLDWYRSNYPNVTVEFAHTSDWQQPEDELLLWQCEPAWKDVEIAGADCSKTLCQTGCWVACSAMSQRFFSTDPIATPVTANTTLGLDGFSGCSCKWSAMSRLGLEVLKRTTDLLEVKAHLSMDGVCFAEVLPTSLEHFVLVTRYEGERFWMLDPWKNKEGWVDESYEGVESWRLVRKHVSPPPPPSKQLISLHLQKRAPYDIEFIARVQPAVVKLVMGMETASEIKAVSPDTLVVYRQFVDNQGQYWYDDDPKRGARRFLETFLDSLERNADVIDYVESLNETIATNDIAGIGQTVAFDTAFCEVLEEEGYPARPGILTGAIGNPQHGEQTRMLIPAVRACVESNGVLCYHGYSYYPGFDHFGTDWRHHAGRGLESWDPEFRAAGIHPNYVFTEAGVCATAHAGWKHGSCMNGSIDTYIEYLLGLRAKIAQWNIAHNHRCLGVTLFTSGGGTQWSSFELQGEHLRKLADALTL